MLIMRFPLSALTGRACSRQMPTVCRFDIWRLHEIIDKTTLQRFRLRPDVRDDWWWILRMGTVSKLG